VFIVHCGDPPFISKGLFDVERKGGSYHGPGPGQPRLGLDKKSGLV
jgi:hypothetical protein